MTDIRKRLETEIRALKPNWRQTYATAAEWAKLDAKKVMESLTALWPKIASATDRQQILKAFFFARHPGTLDLLDLGMRDADEKVRNWAAEYLHGFAFRDFRGKPEEYEKWRAKHRGRPLDDVLRDNARELVDRLKRVPAGELKSASFSLFECVKTGNIAHLVEAGLVELLELWMESGQTEVIENVLRVLPRFPMEEKRLQKTISGWIKSGSPEVRSAVLRRLPQFDLGEKFLKATVEPLLGKSPEKRADLVRSLGKTGAKWAVDILLPWLNDARPDVVLAAAEALAEIGDERAIPPMIEAIRKDNTPKTIYGIGYFGLGRLTGVEYDESHHGGWWDAWLRRRG